MTDNDATSEQGITQQTAPDITDPARTRRLQRIRTTKESMRALGGYTSGGHLINNGQVKDLLDEIMDLEAERDSARDGWDGSSEQFATLQAQTSAEVRRLRDELAQSGRRFRELDGAHAARLQELLELRESLRAYRDSPRPRADEHRPMGAFAPEAYPFMQPPPADHEHQPPTPPPPWAQQAPPVSPGMSFLAGLAGVNRQPPRQDASGDVPPEMRRMIDEELGGRPFNVLRVERPNPWTTVVYTESSIECGDPSVMGVEQLAERWDTTPDLVRAFLNSIEWPHNCERHGHRVRQHEAAELTIRYREWRQGQTGSRPMTAPWASDARHPDSFGPVGEIISAAEVLARGVRVQLQLVELNGRRADSYHPIQLLVAGVPPQAIMPAGLGWEPSNPQCVEAMGTYAQIGAKFRRVG